MKITVIGTGYVGLVTGTCFAETGNKVTCIDIDKAKVDKLTSGQITIYEPGLEKIFLRNTKEGRLVFTTNLEEVLEASEIIFLLDFNALHRVGYDMQNTLESYQNDFVLIDHHQQPDDFTYMYSDVEMCSTCQMVYHFIEKMGDLNLIDSKISTCLYTGIMTDTGSFRFRSTTSLTHRVIADLIDKGAENDRIHSNVYDSSSYGRLQLLGQALSNLKVQSAYKTAYITLTQEEKIANNFKKGDTEGIVNYALSIQGIVMAAIFIEDKEQGIIKISFRSKGTFSVNQFARENFNGGGHDNAAGGKSDLSMEDTINKFNQLLPKNKEGLLKSYEV